MNKETYKSAVKNLRVSSDFNEKTLEFLSNKEIKREKYKKRIGLKYYYGVAVACLALIFFAMPMISNPSIELKNSTGNVKVKYVNNTPNIVAKYSLIGLTEDQIFNEYNTSIFKGKVTEIKNIRIQMGWGRREYRAIATVEVLNSYRGNEKLGDTVKILLPCSINMDIKVEDTGVVSSMNVDTIGIFMPIKYDESSIWQENNATLYLKDVSDYGFLDGERFAFIQTESGIKYSEWAFESIDKNPSLEDIEKYILDMISN